MDSGSHLILFQKLDGAASMLKLALSLSQVGFVKLTVQLAEGLFEPPLAFERLPLPFVTQQQYEQRCQRKVSWQEASVEVVE